MEKKKAGGQVGAKRTWKRTLEFLASKQRFGKLVMTGEFYKTEKKKIFIECVCDCGNIVFRDMNNLRNGHTKSCGCINLKHGYLKRGKEHPLAKVLRSIRSRCLYPSHDRYPCYGGKGVKICDEWVGEGSIPNFIEWAERSGYKEGLTIDRVDNDGNYEPSNCRWVTVHTQMRNRSNNININAFGKTLCITDWEKEDVCSVKVRCIKKRMDKLGWDAERAISTPGRNSHKNMNAATTQMNP